MNLYDVMSDTMVARLLDEGYADNGNWIPAINGIVLPGCTQTEDNPAEPAQSQIRTDSRKAPDAELRYFGGDTYRMQLHFASDQPDIIAEALGMGSEILDQAATNTARTVGNGNVAPTGVDDALFGVFLVTGTGPGSYVIQIPANTLPHSDYEENSMFCFAYDYLNLNCVPITGKTWVGGNAFTGEFKFDPSVIHGNCLFTYDVAESGIVTLGGKSVAVDVKDPTLDNGDQAVILSFAYEYSQLKSARDYSVTQPLNKPERVVIDLFKSFGDTIEGPCWERRRFFDCRQRRIPSKSTSGTNEAANETVYEFLVKDNRIRLGGADRYYARDFLLERLSSS